MKIDTRFIEACQAFLKPEQLLCDEPMSKHTTFEIGGPADCLIFPASLAEVQQVLKLVRTYELPLTILGNGSNLLVRDKGIRGVVLDFGVTMSSIRCEGTRIIAGAGALHLHRDRLADDLHEAGRRGPGPLGDDPLGDAAGKALLPVFAEDAGEVVDGIGIEDVSGGEPG